MTAQGAGPSFIILAASSPSATRADGDATRRIPATVLLAPVRRKHCSGHRCMAHDTLGPRHVLVRETGARTCWSMEMCLVV
eukprot:4906100-Prymnesium_polylepis.1